MRVKSFIVIWILIVAAVGTGAQRGASEPAAGEQFVGTWVGTWDQEGGGPGPVRPGSAPSSPRGFELTLEKAKPKGGALAGRVSVTGGPTYKANLKTVSFKGTTMTAKYDFPEDERAEILLAVVFDGSSAKGSWTVIDKAGAAMGASGTLIVKRK
jgi:hypothetical protein